VKKLFKLNYRFNFQILLAHEFPGIHTRALDWAARHIPKEEIGLRTNSVE